MLAKKLFALCREFPVAGAVPAAKLRFAPQRVNHSQNPQIKEVIMSIIKKLVASFVGLNPAGPRSAMKLLSVLLAFILGATLGVSSAAVAAEKKMVKDPTTGKMVSAPEWGGTITYGRVSWAAHSDVWYISGWATHNIGLVNEMLGIGNWGIDRDVWDWRALADPPLSARKGALAESWETPDDTTIIFNIRKGVYWHDKAPMNGRALTAMDVEYNWHRLIGAGQVQ